MVSSSGQRQHNGQVALWNCAFVTCNQLGLQLQNTNGISKHSFQMKSFEVNLPPLGRSARGRSRIYTLVDSHTLFTHNDTIIFCSLREGLTYSHCAQHAEAVCHKKEYCVSSIRWINFDRSFTFLFTSIDSVQD